MMYSAVFVAEKIKYSVRRRCTSHRVLTGKSNLGKCWRSNTVNPSSRSNKQRKLTFGARNLVSLHILNASLAIESKIGYGE